MARMKRGNVPPRAGTIASAALLLGSRAPALLPRDATRELVFWLQQTRAACRGMPLARTLAQRRCMEGSHAAMSSCVGAAAQVGEWRGVRERLGLPRDARGGAVAEAAAAQQGITAAQLAALVRRAAARYEAKRTDSGPRRAALRVPANLSQGSSQFKYMYETV